MIDFKALEIYRDTGIPWDVLESILMREGDGAQEALVAHGFRGGERPAPDLSAILEEEGTET